MVLKKYDQEKSLVIDIDKNKKKIISPFCIKNKNLFYLFLQSVMMILKQEVTLKYT